ncbi:MAG: hypothetical protein R3A52_21325 [Polyangiales bacterium]
MKSLALRLSLLCAACVACVNDGCLEATEVVLEQRRFDFERDCVGARCASVTLTGDARFGPSLLPGDRALIIGAGGGASLLVDGFRLGTGAGLLANYRCDAEATLTVRHQGACSGGVSVSSTPWAQRYDLLCRRGGYSDPSAPATYGATTLDFAVHGRGECAVDRVVLRALAWRCDVFADAGPD